MLEAPQTGSASAQSQLLANIYVTLAAFVILYYDYVLTLPSEVDRFWATGRLSWASCLFYVNRYLSLFGHIPIIVQYFWDVRHPKSIQCTALASYHQYLAVAIQLIVGILQIVRMYALYNRSHKVLLLICACGLGIVIFGTWTVISGGGAHESGSGVLPLMGCILLTEGSDSNRVALAWTALIAFDLLIFIMTLYKSIGLRRGGNRPLLQILLRDGAVYFGVILVISVLNTLSLYLLQTYDRGLLTTFANVTSSTMMSRLMLNLRDPKLSSSYGIRRLSNSNSTRVTTSDTVLTTALAFDTSDASTSA